MNKPEIVNIAGNFEAEALRILRQIRGLTVEPDAPLGVDAIVRFAGRQEPIAVEVRQRANAATAWQLVQQAGEHPRLPLLLIAGDTTREARQILEDHDIAVVDGLGNAHMELPGLMFHIEGRRRSAKAPPTRLRGKAGVVAQALLLDPTRDWSVQDLAETADVADSLAHRVLTRLEGEGVVTAEGAGPGRVRRVTNPTALLDLWAEEQADHPIRTGAYLLAQGSQQLIRTLDDNLDTAGISHAVTGAAANSLVAPFTTSVPVVEIWVAATAAPEALHDAAKTDGVPQGANVAFLQLKDDTPLAFAEQVDDVTLVNRFRLYADLRRDPRRGREQAEHLREEVIRF